MTLVLALCAVLELKEDKEDNYQLSIPETFSLGEGECRGWEPGNQLLWIENMWIKLEALVSAGRGRRGTVKDALFMDDLISISMRICQTHVFPVPQFTFRIIFNLFQI